MSTSTPAGDSVRDRALRQLTSNLANAGGSPTAAASAEQVLAGQGLTLQAAEIAAVAGLERVGAAGTGQPETRQTDYLVGVENRTSSTVFSEIVVAFGRTGQEPQAIQATNVGPGRGIAFPLGSCSALQGYIVFFAVGGNEAGQIPANGVMNAQLASQLNPADTDPCTDVWAVGDG
jgi:hypothetical protein